MRSSNVFIAEVALLFVAFFWGTNPAAIKIGLLFMPVMVFNTLRILVGLVVAWVAVLWTKTYRPLDKEDLMKIVMISVFGFSAFQYLLVVGAQYTAAGNVSLILALLPISVALINRLWHNEKIAAVNGLGIGVSLGGVILIIVGSGKELSLASDHLIGTCYILLAQGVFGYYTVFSKGLLQKYSTYYITVCVLTVTVLLFLPFVIADLPHIRWSEIPLSAWLSMAFSGIFPLCVANFLWIWGAGQLGSTKASLYNNIGPVFAVIAGYVLLGEGFGMLQFLGAVVIFVGLYFTRLKPSLSRSN
ncbi:MAG: DMT family transporter [Negativicutes bacterium]|nr:DMT family transporter [Negativicutes bacterium]